MTESKQSRSRTARGPVASIKVFEKLPAAEWAALERRLVEKRFAKSESIFLDGDPAGTAWFVKEGHVKAVTHAANGRCQILCMAGPGRMFGSCCALGGGTYPCQALAETDAVVVGLPMADFLGVLERHPGVGLRVAAEVSERLRHSKESHLFEQESVEKRILRVLLDLRSEFGDLVPLTKREVAEMAGTTVETCIRTFSRLEEEGLVAGERGRITVKDPSALEDRLDAE